MRPTAVVCLALLAVACGTSTSGTEPTSDGGSGGTSSSSGGAASGSSGGASTSSSGSSSGGGESSSGGSGGTAGSSGSGSSSGGGSSGMGADGGSGDAGSGDDAGAVGDTGAGGSSGGDGGSAAGDGGSCSGTVYGAGNKCPGNVPAAAGAPPCAVLGGAAHPSTCAAVCTTCPPDGQACCPAQTGTTVGYDVGNLLLGGKDSVTFTGVYAPADGDYNIVWYYHCGNADTDNNYPPSCPGSKEGSTTGPPGCRQALFDVNGVTDPTVYEVPCFLQTQPGDGWPLVHSWVRDDPVTKVLVPFHLKAGSSNTIRIYAGTHDTVDMSAIRVPDGR